MKDIVIECSKADLKDLDPLKPHGLTVIEAKKFDATDMVHGLITLTTMSLPLVTSVIIALIRARKHVKIITKGAEIHGVSEEAAIRFLQDCFDRDAR